MSSETDSASPPSLNIEKCALIIVDVAGTTTSINFVQDTLFPYALKHAESFLQSKWDEETVKDCVKDLKENDAELDVAAAVKLVKALSEKNSDNKGLKTLQGLIYQQGYESGELKAHIFDDVAEAFESWAKARNVAIYSTGSIESQRLLFKHTTSGDVSAHIFKYFDQSSIGAKTESESYKKIAKEFQLEPEEVIFVTDNVEEAKAAKSAGITAVLINREGNPSIPEEASKDFKVISSFSELGLEKAAKRKIEEPATASEEPPAKVAKTSVEEKVEEEKPKTEEVTSMEVDAPAPEEKVVETAKTEESKVSEEPKTVSETEKVDAAATEKTESAETVEKVAEDEEMKSVEEKKPAEESKPEETKEKEDQAKEKENTEEKKPEEEESISEKKVEESTAEKKVEEVATVDKKTAEEDSTTEKKVEETTNEKPAENGEEPKPEEEQDGEKTKTDESEPKTEEKENKSVLANGVENGNKVDSEIEKNDKESETSEIKKDDLEVNVDKTEVIVKKLEESTESKTVSVEV